MLKTLLTSFVIISGMALLGSCNKCKNCECTSVTSQTGMPDLTQSYSVESCDKEEQNELQGTNTVSQGMPGFEQQISTTCGCE